jgi:hypothetical protein
MTAKENETDTALRRTAPDEKTPAELVNDEPIDVKREGASQGEAVRVDRSDRPAANANRMQEPSSFFSPAESQTFRSRWNNIQVRFVDDPPGAIDEANNLVSDAIEHLKQGFSAQRQPRGQTSDPNPRDSTEERRLLLRRYRTLVERLVSI